MEQTNKQTPKLRLQYCIHKARITTLVARPETDAMTDSLWQNILGTIKGNDDGAMTGSADNDSGFN